MPLIFSKNILDALRDNGYNTYRLRNEKLLSESTIQKLRHNEGVSWENLETLCKLLECQPGDIIQFIPDEKN